ncbi:MAG: CYTH domain-containing protein [Mycobacterium sp.]|nr:CYTH domain-containing protein [Mycobacterium sp.]
MSGAGQEIEVKYRLSDSAEAVVAALTVRGVKLSAPVRQDDQAYAREGWSYGMSKVGVPFARLRTENARHLFTLKKPLDNEMACVEHESVVADRAAMHEAILHMGFYPTIRIVKTSRVARLGELAVCLDDVEHAGSFLEVEQVVGPDRSGIAVQAELDAFVRSLGVAVERTTDTYDSLVRAALATV